MKELAEEIAAAFHVHQCAEWQQRQTCEAPCLCSCGARLDFYKDTSGCLRWAWMLPDGSQAPFPDPALEGE